MDISAVRAKLLLSQIGGTKELTKELCYSKSL